MSKKKPYVQKTLPELEKLWQAAALHQPNQALTDGKGTLPERLQQFMEFLTKNQPTKRPEDMYCFIMYDIENDKIRRLMAKYLEQKGCVRVQKSVFFGRFHRKLQREVTDVLRKMQACYENEDSILVLPVGEDILNSLTCIGKEFELQLMTAPKHTLFF